MDSISLKVIFILLIVATNYDVSNAIEVTTNTTATLWVGTEGVLLCRVSDQPLSVTWSSGVTRVAILDQNDDLTLPGGANYDMSRVNDQFLLHIKDVSLSDEGTFNCAAAVEEGQIIYDGVDVTVYDSPDKPFPTINECSNITISKENSQTCSVELANVTDIVNLTCEAHGFYPRIDLVWSAGGDFVNPIAQASINNTDGSFNGTVTIEATARPEHYVCTASGTAVSGPALSAHVRVHVPGENTPIPEPTATPTPDSTTEDTVEGPSSNTGMWVGIALAGVVGIIAVIFVIYKMKHKINLGTNRGGSNIYSYSGVDKKMKAHADDEEKGEVPERQKLKEDNWNVAEEAEPEPEPKQEPEEKVKTEVIDAVNSSEEKNPATVTVGVEEGPKNSADEAVEA